MKTKLLWTLLLALLAAGIGTLARFYPQELLAASAAALVVVGGLIWRAITGNSLIRYRAAEIGQRVQSKLERAERAYHEAAQLQAQGNRVAQEVVDGLRTVAEELRNRKKQDG